MPQNQARLNVSCFQLWKRLRGELAHNHAERRQEPVMVHGLNTDSKMMMMIDDD